MGTAPYVKRLTLPGKDPIVVTYGADLVQVYDSAHEFGQSVLQQEAAGRFQPRLWAIDDPLATDQLCPLLLSITTTQGAALARRGPSGWTSADLSARIAAAMGASAAGAVDAMGAACDAGGRLTLAVAVRDASGCSRLFIAYNLLMSGDLSAIEFTDLGLRAGVIAEGLRVVPNGDGSWTVVVAANIGARDTLLLLRSDQKWSFASAPLFNPGLSFTDIRDFEAGVHPSLGAGVYVAGLNGSVSNLVFRPFPAFDSAGRVLFLPPVCVLPAPKGGANVLDALPTRDGSTDLYMGGDEGVFCVAAADQRQGARAPIREVTKGVAGVSALDTRRAADGTVSVWALNDAKDLYFCAQASGGYSNPLRLRRGVQELAACAGDAHQSATLVAIYDDFSAAILRRDGQSGVWTDNPVLIRNPDEVAELSCYVTHLRLLDGQNNPRIGVPVTLLASSFTEASVNGAAAFLGPKLATTAVTDGHGSVAITLRARTLTPPCVRAQPAGATMAIDLNPAEGAHTQMRALSGDDLAQPGAAGPALVPEPSSATGVASTLNTASTLLFTSGIVAPTAPFSNALRAEALTAPLSVTASKGSVSAGGDASGSRTGAVVGFGTTVADFFEALAVAAVDRVESVIQAVFTAVKGVITVSVNIAGKIVDYVISAAEEVGAFFSWVWAEVKAANALIYKYFSFLFSWQDILNTRDLFTGWIDQAFTIGENLANSFRTGFDEVIDALADKMGLTLPEIAPASQSGDTASTQDSMMGNSVVAWLFEKLGQGIDQLISVPEEAFVQLGAAFSTLGSSVVDGLADDAKQTVQAVITDITTAFSQVQDLRSITPTWIGTTLMAILKDVAAGLLGGVKVVVDALLVAAGQLLQAGRNFLFGTIRFPLFEKILAALGINADLSFRLVDAASIVVALPTTIVFKLVTGRAPVLPGEDLSLPTDIAFGQAAIPPLVRPLIAFGVAVVNAILLIVALAKTATAKAAAQKTDAAKETPPDAAKTEETPKLTEEKAPTVTTTETPPTSPVTTETPAETPPLAQTPPETPPETPTQAPPETPAAKDGPTPEAALEASLRTIDAFGLATRAISFLSDVVGVVLEFGGGLLSKLSALPPLLDLVGWLTALGAMVDSARKAKWAVTSRIMSFIHGLVSTALFVWDLIQTGIQTGIEFGWDLLDQISGFLATFLGDLSDSIELFGGGEASVLPYVRGGAVAAAIASGVFASVSAGIVTYGS